MQKNSIYEGAVEALGTDGEGIIKSEGTTAFVPFCLVGERVKFKALKVNGNIAYGKLEEVLTPAYSRVNPPCPVFGKCGGCAIQHMDYAEQLVFKRQTVQNSLFKIGGVSFNVGGTVPCESQYRYRNKLALPIGEINGETVCGFYSLHSHRIVPVKDCLIQSEWAKTVIAAIENFAKAKHISGYNEQTRKGILRRVVVREVKGKYIFALVTTKIIDVSYLLKELEKSFEDFTFLLNVNAAQNNVIFSKEWRICRGNGYFEAEDCNIKYKAGANTFLQINDNVRAKLYARVLEEAEEGAAALDLYSGGGMLTAMLAKKCGLAYGVEIVEEASRCADELKAANGLEEKMFNICGKVEENIDKVFSLTRGKRRIIVCDPPRKGMERSVVKAIAQSGVDKIILVSCNPSTLARDLGLLMGTLEDINGALFKMGGENGLYKIESITPFDMFPQTKHVETLVVLSHKKPDGHINIKVEFGEEEGQVSLKEVAKRAEERKPKEKITYKGNKFFRGRIINDVGYTADNMGAPPPDKATAGRANSAGIPRLYLATNKQTALHELRAGAFDSITIGEFELLKDITVVDLKMLDKISPFIEELDPRLLLINRECLNKINEEICKPLRKNDSTLDYLPTQYIVDLIQSFINEGESEYNGVEYKSTLNSDGVNLAIFDTTLFCCKSVQDYEVKELIYKVNPEF